MKRDKIHVNDRQLACSHIHSTEGQNYLKAMAAAANYAWVNRSSMTFLTRQVSTMYVGLDLGHKLSWCNFVDRRLLQRHLTQPRMILTCILFMMSRITLLNLKSTYPRHLISTCMYVHVNVSEFHLGREVLGYSPPPPPPQKYNVEK